MEEFENWKKEYGAQLGSFIQSYSDVGSHKKSLLSQAQRRLSSKISKTIITEFEKESNQDQYTVNRTIYDKTYEFTNHTLKNTEFITVKENDKKYSIHIYKCRYESCVERCELSKKLEDFYYDNRKDIIQSIIKEPSGEKVNELFEYLVEMYLYLHSFPYEKSSLLAKIEDQVSKFLPVLIHYYDAKLSIISEPSSAEIWFNDQKIGQTPSRSLAVPANHPHQLEIKKKGYVTHRRVVKIQSGQHLLVDIDLIDQITDQLLQKQRHLDSMNFSLGSQLHLHSLNQSILKVLPATSFRYLSKFGTWQFGFDFSSTSWEGKQKIDTVLGPNTGSSRFTFQMNRFVFLSQYNLIEWTNQLDLYVGLQLGITTSQFDYQTTPIIDRRLTELETSNPVAGVEVGSRIYFGHHLKMQLFTGAEFSGTVIYYQKQRIDTSFFGLSNGQPSDMHFFSVCLSLCNHVGSETLAFQCRQSFGHINDLLLI